MSNFLLKIHAEHGAQPQRVRPQGEYEVRANWLYQLLDHIADYATEDGLSHLIGAVTEAKTIARLEMDQDGTNVIPFNRSGEASAEA